MSTRKAKNYIERGAIVTATIESNHRGRKGSTMTGVVVKVRAKQPRRKTRNGPKPDPYTVAEVQEYGSGLVWTINAARLRRIGTATEEELRAAAAEADQIRQSIKDSRARRKEHGITTNKAYRRLTGLEAKRIGDTVYIQLKNKKGESIREPGMLAGYSPHTGQAYVHTGDAEKVSTRKVTGGTRYTTCCRWVTPEEDTPTPVEVDLEEAKIVLDTEPTSEGRVTL